MARPLRRSPRRSRRGVELIEFTMLLPVTVFFIIFILNLGTLMITSGVLHDAAYTAAETGAQVGSITPGGPGTTDSAWSSANETLENLGLGYSATNLSVVDADVTTDQGSGASNVCTSGDDGYTVVTVTLSYDAPLLPGMGALLSLVAGGGSSDVVNQNSLALHATGIARCEIAQE